MENIGERIKKYRLDKGFSLHTLAKLSNVTHTTIASIEKNKDRKSITVKLARDIAMALDISFWELIQIEDSKELIALKEKNDALKMEIDDLKEKLRKMEFIFEGFFDSLGRATGAFTNYIVSDIQYTLSHEKNEKRMKELFKYYNKIFSHYYNMGYVDVNDINHQILGMENAYTVFIQWFNEYKKKHDLKPLSHDKLPDWFKFFPKDKFKPKTNTNEQPD